MKFVAGALFIFLSFTYAFTTEYVYELGYNLGDIVFIKEDRIPPFTPNTKINITIPMDTELMYIRVTVEAVGPPEVLYDMGYQTIYIIYNWTQISDSTYNILVKAFPNQDS